jgi:hypothetical protein
MHIRHQRKDTGSLHGESIGAIRTHEIDIGDPGSGPPLEPQDYLRLQLQKLGLFDVQYLYSSVRPHLEKLVRATGTYRGGPDAEESDVIHACHVQADSQTGKPIISDVGDFRDLVYYLRIHAESTARGVFVVYRRDCFQHANKGAESFRFIEPAKKLSAVVAIVGVTNF